MNDSDSVCNIIQQQIEDNKTISVEEKLALGRALDAAKKLNGEQGLLGEALKQSIYSRVVFQCGEADRIHKIVDASISTHTANCQLRGDTEERLFGTLRTRWGTVNGLSLALLILVSGVIVWKVGPVFASVFATKAAAAYIAK